jgi:hypothetical protein
MLKFGNYKNKSSKIVNYSSFINLIYDFLHLDCIESLKMQFPYTNLYFSRPRPASVLLNIQQNKKRCIRPSSSTGDLVNTKLYKCYIKNCPQNNEYTRSMTDIGFFYYRC